MTTINTDLDSRLEFVTSLHYGCNGHSVGEDEAVFNFFGWGDYWGSSVDRSNAEVMQEWLDSEGLDYEVIHGHYYSQFLQIDLTVFNDEQWIEFAEMMAALQDYPLLSDERHTVLEMAEYIEQWDNYVTEDCLKAIFPGICLDYIDYDNDEVKYCVMSLHSDYDNGNSCLEYTSYYYSMSGLKNVKPEEKHSLARLLAKHRE